MRPLPCLFVALSLVRAGAANDYALTADSLAVAAGTPTGRVVRVELPQSRVYPGSGHECWLYIPDRPAPEKGYALMVFQDGGGYLNRQGAWRVPNVLDNLIHRGELPPMAALFVNPGVLPAASTNALPRFNRSFEYDSVDDRYARFLEEEVLPAAGRLAPLSPDPGDRGIAGASSGGICAFNAAFRRPDLFRRVFCTIGTFVGLRGGDELATLVRKTEPLPVRVFLQDGSNDNNIYAGDWWMENQTLDRALEFAGYDHRCVWGDGGHDSKQGGMVFPEAMRWLWRDHPKPLAANPEAKSRAPVAGWVTPGGEWTQIEAPAGDIFPAAMVAGVLLILWGLATLLGTFGVRLPAVSVPPALASRIARGVRAVQQRPPAVRGLAIGMLTAALPCGWLYAFVFTAAGTGRIDTALGTMAIFWLGTLPMMLSVGYGAQRLTGAFRSRLPMVTAAAVVVMGVLSLTGRMRLDPEALSARARQLHVTSGSPSAAHGH